MTKKDFVRLCMLCGYASKKNAIKYAESKETLTEEDLQKVFAINERQNDVKHGVTKSRNNVSGNELIDRLGDTPDPWNRIFDPSRGIKNWDKAKADE